MQIFDEKKMSYAGINECFYRFGSPKILIFGESVEQGVVLYKCRARSRTSLSLSAFYFTVLRYLIGIMSGFCPNFFSQKCSIFPQNGHFGRIWTFCHTLWTFWQTNAIWHRCCNYKGVNAKYAYKPRTLRYKHCLTNLGGKNYETCNVS